VSDDLMSKGLEIRRKVVGKEYVDRAMESADDFTADLQRLVSTYCWGEVWGRDGLSHRDRSMINLAMIATLNRPHELALHVRGALRNGLTRDEIKEVLLQVTIYAGVPAGVDAFRIARQALAEADREND